MRTVSLTLLIIAGLALALGGGFLLYLNWAFTPRGPSSSRPRSSYRIHSAGSLDDARFYAIFESRMEGGNETIYGVALAADRATVERGEGSNILFIRNAPIPTAVRLARPGIADVDFDRPIQPTGAKHLEIDLEKAESSGFIQIVDGKLVE